MATLVAWKRASTVASISSVGVGEAVGAAASMAACTVAGMSGVDAGAPPVHPTPVAIAKLTSMAGNFIRQSPSNPYLSPGTVAPKPVACQDYTLSVAWEGPRPESGAFVSLDAL